MTRDEILKAPSMPAFAPSYPHRPFLFIRREYLIITYETDPNAIRIALPEPHEPAAGALAFYERMKMPDASCFGDYEESGTGIYATFKGEPCNFSVQMYLDDEPPMTGGREIWGFPKKHPACQLPRRRLARAAGCWGPPSDCGLRPPLRTCAVRLSGLTTVVPFAAHATFKRVEKGSGGQPERISRVTPSLCCEGVRRGPNQAERLT